MGSITIRDQSSVAHSAEKSNTGRKINCNDFSRKKIHLIKKILSLHCSFTFTQSVISHPYSLSQPALFNETRLHGFFGRQYCQLRSKNKQANKTNNFIIIIILYFSPRPSSS